MIAVTDNSIDTFESAIASGASLVELLLAEQQTPTAIERFARRAADAPHDAARYRDLLPVSTPSAGEQYAFSVDLDLCSGCKACVTACHQLNGLEDDESWRDVGLLVADAPRLSIGESLEHASAVYVTSACHHCVDPGCLRGCPTRAYEKDPTTGVVRHLDDQCFGCQYCTMTCPYDVPKYRPSLGIVRKCDMCRQRLAVGEAPACVQACPNRAISIHLVATDDARRLAARGEFLPSAPDPRLTVPTTRFTTANPARLATLHAVGERLDRPEHVPGSLVAMLVATQFGVGLATVAWLLGLFTSGWTDAAQARASVIAAVVGIVGVHMALLHLGRPSLAYKAWLGWRTSWLSREAIAFGLWMPAATLFALDGLGLLPLGAFGRHAIGGLTALVGAASIGCSAMIYAATGRPTWSAVRTTARFALTALVLGSATAAAVAPLGQTPSVDYTTLIAVAACALIVKLIVEAEPLWRRRSSRDDVMARSRRLLVGPLREVWTTRCLAALVGIDLAATIPSPYGPALGALVLFAGELLARTLFFAAVVPPRMPRSLAA